MRDNVDGVALGTDGEGVHGSETGLTQVTLVGCAQHAWDVDRVDVLFVLVDAQVKVPVLVALVELSHDLSSGLSQRAVVGL